MVGNCPEWMPLAYTVQSAVYLPTRIWSYKKKAYHYFLFGKLLSHILFFAPKLTSVIACYRVRRGCKENPQIACQAANHFVSWCSLCYFVNIMDLIWLWFFPSNVYFFITCWCLTLGESCGGGLFVALADILSFYRAYRQCHHHVAEFPCLPQYRQGAFRSAMIVISITNFARRHRSPVCSSTCTHRWY
jgi:hypothetical protein